MTGAGQRELQRRAPAPLPRLRKDSQPPLPPLSAVRTGSPGPKRTDSPLLRKGCASRRPPELPQQLAACCWAQRRRMGSGWPPCLAQQRQQAMRRHRQRQQQVRRQHLLQLPVLGLAGSSCRGRACSPPRRSPSRPGLPISQRRTWSAPPPRCWRCAHCPRRRRRTSGAAQRDALRGGGRAPESLLDPLPQSLGGRGWARRSLVGSRESPLAQPEGLGLGRAVWRTGCPTTAQATQLQTLQQLVAQHKPLRLPLRPSRRLSPQQWPRLPQRPAP